MLGRQFAALGEAAAGEDVSVRRSHVAFIRTVFSYAVEEVSDREDVNVIGPIFCLPGFIEYSLGRPWDIGGLPKARVQAGPSFQKQRHNFRPSFPRYRAILDARIAEPRAHGGWN